MLWFAVSYALVLICAARVLLRPHRAPESRLAWLAVIFALPGVGVLAYVLLGETNIGARRTRRVREVIESLPRPESVQGWAEAVSRARTSSQMGPLASVGRSISGYGIVGGNRAELMPDSDSAIDRMVADIDSARRHVHLMFYIWLPDNNGLKMVEALKRAAARGVVCRAMADGLGSRAMIRSRHWSEMSAAGVRVTRVDVERHTLETLYFAVRKASGVNRIGEVHG